MPEEKSSADGVTWDLSDLYASIDDPKIESDVQAIEGRAKNYEKKIQGNPESNINHNLIKHTNAQIFEDAPRTFNGLKNWLANKNIEGLVFYHPDGRMAKIKKRDFSQKRN